MRLYTVILFILMSWHSAATSRHCKDVSNPTKELFIGLFASELKTAQDRSLTQLVCEDIASKLEDTKNAWPAYCNTLSDPTNGKNLYPGASWDQRRCFSDLVVSDFKSQLQGFASANNSKLHRDGQKYREIEVRYFLMATRPQCFHHKNLYTLYSCVEDNGRALLGKFGELKRRWNEFKSSPVELKQICNAMDSLLFTKAELRFFATRGQGQRRVEGFPAYQECRKQNLLAILSSCGKGRNFDLSERQWMCLKGAVHGLSEDIQKYDRYGSDASGYHYLVNNLHLLKYKALRVSVMARMCVNQLSYNSLFSPAVHDEQVSYFCQSNSIKKLLGLKVKKEETENTNVNCTQDEIASFDQDLLDLAFSMKEIQKNLNNNDGELKTYAQWMEQLKKEITQHLKEMAKSRPSKMQKIIQRNLESKDFLKILFRNKEHQIKAYEIQKGLTRAAAYLFIKDEILDDLNRAFPANNSEQENLILSTPRQSIDPKREELLVKDAHRALSGENVNMLNFILKADGHYYQHDLNKLTSKQQRFLQLFKKARQSLGTPPYSRQEIFDALDIIYDTTTRYYRGPYRSMLDFFDTDEQGRTGANCVGRTKLIAALFHDDPNVKIQIYTDHVQAVWVGEGDIIDLVSKRGNQNKLATIYEKDMLYLSFLKPREEVTLNDYKQYYYSGISPTAFESSHEVNFAWPRNQISYEGNAPDYSDDGPLQKIKKQEGILQEGILADPELISYLKLLYSFDSESIDLRKNENAVWGPDEDIMRSKEWWDNRSGLELNILNNTKYRDRYSDIKDKKEKTAFALKIILKQILSLINSSEFKMLAERVKNANSISDLSHSELERIRLYLSFIFHSLYTINFNGKRPNGNLKVMLEGLIKLGDKMNLKDILRSKNVGGIIGLVQHTALYQPYKRFQEQYQVDTKQFEQFKGRPREFFQKLVDEVKNEREMETLVGLLNGAVGDFVLLYDPIEMSSLFSSYEDKGNKRENYRESLTLLQKLVDKSKEVSTFKIGGIDTLILSSDYFSSERSDKIIDPLAQKMYLEAFENVVESLDRHISQLNLVKNKLKKTKKGKREQKKFKKLSELDPQFYDILPRLCSTKGSLDTVSELKKCSQSLKASLEVMKVQKKGFWPHSKR